MKQNKIYKFTNKTINIKQYIKDINNIHNIVIFGNTTNLLGTFERVYTDKENEVGYEYNDILYDNPCPLPKFDNLENSNDNLDIFDKLIDNNADILIICGNDVTKTYWEDIYEYYVIRNNGIEIKNFRMLNFDENKDKNRYEDEVDKIIEKNKKFDVCLMNPPYGNTGGDDIHYRITEKIINISNQTICIMPFALINSYTKINNKYKPILGKYLVHVDEVDSKLFSNTNMLNVGIFVFNNKKEKSKICINYLNKSIYVNELSCSPFTSYEQNIIKYLKDNNSLKLYHGVGEFTHYNSDCKKGKIERSYETLQEYKLKNCKKLIDNKIYLNTNVANGSMNATFININSTGQIFKNKQELINYILSRNVSTGYNILAFNSINSAENCKHALINSVLRFTLSKLQTDQNMSSSVYQYIPDINWEDTRVITDEGLLEVCGCPKDKCKEYAEYCKNYMKKFDLKNKTK